MTSVSIIGAGFSGICAAIELQRAGISFTVFEASDGVGGTWFANRYPGAACDIPSALYSLSREPNPDWSHHYARQPEIRAYLERVVDRYDLRQHIRLGERVSSARWSQEGWTLTTPEGEYRSNFVIHGIGALRDPAWPSIDGIEGFRGPVIHSARWPNDLDLSGKRVGVIGTGASAIQLVPSVADDAKHITVFQRTPPWIRPRRDGRIQEWKKRIYRRVPALMALQRAQIYARLELVYPFVFGSWHRRSTLIERHVRRAMEREIHDERLREAALPNYRMGCKRVLVSDTWFAALHREDVTLECTPIERVTRDGVETTDGIEHDLDILVCCTGYQIDNPLGTLQVTGIDGVDLKTVWGRRPFAHMGITVPAFPNMFMLLGPNSALGHSSVVIMIEAAMRYTLKGIRHAQQHGPVDVRPEAAAAFVRDLNKRHQDQVWMSGCDSWYNTKDGENFTIWPGTTWSYLRRTRTFDAENYSISKGRTASI